MFQKQLETALLDFEASTAQQPQFQTHAAHVHEVWYTQDFDTRLKVYLVSDVIDSTMRKMAIKDALEHLALEP